MEIQPIYLPNTILWAYDFITIYYVNNTTYINQQLLKVKALATCFSYSELSSGQKKEHSSGTFSDCALYGIPYRLHFIL